MSVYSPGSRVMAEQMAGLLTAADQIGELNLQDAGLEDSALADVGRLAEVTRLRLSHNELTDRAVAALSGMKRLERVNLYSNPGITDASVYALVGMKSLRRLDVWNTGMTQAGMARLRELRPDLDVQGAASPFAFESAAVGGAN